MNYKFLQFACLLLFACIVFAVTNIAYADDFVPVDPYKPNGLPNNIYPDLRDSIQKRIDELDRLSGRIKQNSAEIQDIRRSKGSADITLKKNYPIVPYDPNHPNVAQPKKPKSIKFTVPANAKVLAGRLVQGLNYAALGLAVADLIGEGVDWVLDPENNSIRYNSHIDTSCYSVANKHVLSESKRYGIQVSTDEAINIDATTCRITLRYHHSSENETTYTFYESLSTSDESLSLDTIAEHIINNDTTNNHYTDAVTDTITEQIDKGMHDDDIKNALDHLNDTADESETDTEDTEDTENSDSKFKLPEFCDWASWFCSDELENPDDTKVEVQHEELTLDKVNINFGGSCPAGNSFAFNIGGTRFTFTLSYEHVCKIAQSMGVLVRILSTIVAVYIIAGIKGGG